MCHDAHGSGRNGYAVRDLRLDVLQIVEHLPASLSVAGLPGVAARGSFGRAAASVNLSNAALTR
jgi:hypothetical protein